MLNKKLVNDPLKVADELLDGLVEAYDGECVKVGRRSIVKTSIPHGKVALLVGGGSGHEPIYHGLVGRNLADGAACGDIFAAPTPDIVLEATRAVNRGNGVLYLYGNYAGDVMNFDIGSEDARDEGIDVRTVLIWDDVCSAPPTSKSKRRGVAGLVPIVKLVGAASQTVKSLADLERIALKAVLHTRSVGVSMSPGSIPATGKPTFDIDPNKIGLGMGIHGEPGVAEIPMTTADDLTGKMLDLIFKDFTEDGEVEELRAGDEIIFFVNSLGATTMMECLIALRKAKQLLNARGIRVYDTIVGPLVTCQEMSGLSFSVTKLDAELKGYWNLPCESVCYSKMETPGAVAVSAPAPAAAAVPSGPGLGVNEVHEMLRQVALRIIAAEPILTDADRALGDGDHGLGMQRGMEAVLEALGGRSFATVDEPFTEMGRAMMSSMGGASGVVFGTLFRSAGRELKGRSVLDAAGLAVSLQAAVESIQQRGGAKPGDKTMLDALDPAARRAAEVVSLPLTEALKAVSDAATAGMEASRNLIATMGRAKTLGERSIGHPDAGAVSIAIIFQAMRDYANQ
ncbi:MAG: dihydroxyacetone kinase [Verrucomicrobia bacterium]|jgi:dihydroxyacetone kinase phosphoprotein-dependent L subunit|nr:MAG: dihydroxyacetone kinase [Verrucomicrobiota bacterium]